MDRSDNGGMPSRGSAGPGWTFLTNHAHVLLAIANDPEVRMRDVAGTVGVTERAVQMIVADLEDQGYLQRNRIGRRNHYVINDAANFRHPAENSHRIGELLSLFKEQDDPGAGGRPRST